MKKIKVGIFGFGRGSALADNLLAADAEIVAVCEKSHKKLQDAKNKLGNTAAYYEDFDSFIAHDGLQAVLLTNYFHEHSEYAIRCLE